MPLHDNTSLIFWFFIWSIWSPICPLKSITCTVMKIIVIWWGSNSNIRSRMMITKKHLSTQPSLMISFFNANFEYWLLPARSNINKNWPFLLVMVARSDLGPSEWQSSWAFWYGFSKLSITDVRNLCLLDWSFEDLDDFENENRPCILIHLKLNFRRLE